MSTEGILKNVGALPPKSTDAAMISSAPKRPIKVAKSIYKLLETVLAHFPFGLIGR
jgi:hypothetical protein